MELNRGLLSGSGGLGDHPLAIAPRSMLGDSRLLAVALTLLGGSAVGLIVVVSTYYVDNLKLLIGVLGGIALVGLTLRWPEVGILGLVAITGGLVDPKWLPALPVGPISLQIPDLLLILLLGVVFLRTTAIPGHRFLESPMLLPLILFLAALVISVLEALFVYQVGRESVLRTARVFAQWAVFIPALQLIRDERTLRRLLLGLWLLAGLFILGVAFPVISARFHVLFVNDSFVLETAGQSAAGITRIFTPADRLFFALIPVALCSLAMIGKGSQLWRIAMLGALSYWLLRSYQRNYWATMACCCLLLLFLLTQRERARLLGRLTPLLAVVALSLIVLVSTQPQMAERLFHASTERALSLTQDLNRIDSSIQWRAFETRYALLEVSRQPILGLGVGNAYRPPMEIEAQSLDYDTWSQRFVHNAYLWIAVAMGLAGLVPFLWLCAAYVLQTFRHWREIKDDELRATYLGLGIAFCGAMVSNVVAPNFTSDWSLAAYPVMMATSEAIYRLARREGGTR